MRQLLTVTLLVLCQFSFGQLSLRPKANIPDFYTFNNTRDTIFLTIVHLGHFTQTDSIKIIDSIQIDGIDSKELVFERYMHGNTNAHGGMFDIEDYIVIKKYEIWNLDTKTLLFEAVSDYKNDFNNSYAYDFHCGLASCRQGQGSAKYIYDFTINTNGHIRITNLKNTTDCMPDHAEGSYKFLNGKYTIE
jgi:hypothetical protein